MEVSLRAEAGREQGSRASRRLRRAGSVPAVLYGHGIDPLPVSVNHREFAAIIKGEGGENAIIALNVDGHGTFTTLAREVVKNPTKPFINHIDFLQISLDELVTAEVGLEFIGEPLGVKNDGGIVETMRVTVQIEALPTAIPGHIDVDISHLEIHDLITVADLPQIEGVSYLEDEGTPVVTVSLPASVLAEGDAAATAGEVGDAADEADGEDSEESSDEGSE
jgi:large subunit ribosomal protein L25